MEELTSVPLPARWYHLQEGRQLGPVDLQTMRELVLEGVIGPATYVWADGMPEWRRAAAVPALVPPRELRGQLRGDADEW